MRQRERKNTEESDVPIAINVPHDVAEMLEKAKAATGRTKKHLLTEAIRLTCSRYIEQAPA